MNLELYTHALSYCNSNAKVQLLKSQLEEAEKDLTDSEKDLKYFVSHHLKDGETIALDMGDSIRSDHKNVLLICRLPGYECISLVRLYSAPFKSNL
jgi:high-affinity K+ transport system ATPase subunit B